MVSKEALVGVVVQVMESHTYSPYGGMRGIIKRSYGDPNYLALDVLLEDGRLVLFWFYQLDKAVGT